MSEKDKQIKNSSVQTAKSGYFDRNYICSIFCFVFCFFAGMRNFVSKITHNVIFSFLFSMSKISVLFTLHYTKTEN